MQGESGLGTNLRKHRWEKVLKRYLAMHSLAKVADGAQGPLQGVEVVHLLETDDVWLVSNQLLQYPPPPDVPAQSLGRALHKLVALYFFIMVIFNDFLNIPWCPGSVTGDSTAAHEHCLDQ